MSIINEMFDNGYILDEISVNGHIHMGDSIRFIDFLDFVYIEFHDGKMLVVPDNKIDYISISLEEEDD